MSVVELQIAGFGGQGVVLAGMTIGRGLVLYDNYHVSLTQSFGPEARGSACSVQLMISSDPVMYPYVQQPGMLVAMSQEAFRKFSPHLRDGGLLLVEEDLVGPLVRDDVALARRVRVHTVPATRLAEELGRRLVLNMVMVGFFTAITGLLAPDLARRAVRELVPQGTEALNLAAFEKGFAAGMVQMVQPAGV